MMRHGLAWVCVLGGLFVGGMVEGRAPVPEPAGPRSTKRRWRKCDCSRRSVATSWATRWRFA